MNPTIIKYYQLLLSMAACPSPNCGQAHWTRGWRHYWWDYVIHRKTFYTRQGQWQETAITYQNLPDIAETLDQVALLAAIRDSQLNHQVTHNFSYRADASRCTRLYCLFTGKTRYLLGRDGLHNILSGFPVQDPIAKAQTIDKNKLTTACFSQRSSPQLTFYCKMLQ